MYRMKLKEMNEEVWYFIGAVVLLVINYCMASKAGEIANDKGYDENLWKWSCFFFAIAYILEEPIPEYWVCKRCGFTNTKEAHYCKQCGDYKW